MTLEAGQMVYVVMGDDGGSFEHECYLVSIHVSRYAAEEARDALKQRYATVEEVELKP